MPDFDRPDALIETGDGAGTGHVAPPGAAAATGHPLDATAMRLFITALQQDRAGELLACLFDGGAATVDPGGRLQLITKEEVGQLAGSAEPEPVSSPVRSFESLRDSGVLWAINAHVFHPRGFAIAIDLDDDGKATGWTLMGDGTEPWGFTDDAATHDVFARFQRFIDDHRRAPAPAADPVIVKPGDLIAFRDRPIDEPTWYKVDLVTYNEWGGPATELTVQDANDTAVVVRPPGRGWTTADGRPIAWPLYLPADRVRRPWNPAP